MPKVQDAGFEENKETEVQQKKDKNSNAGDEEGNSTDEEKPPSEVPEGVIRVASDGEIMVNKISRVQFLNGIQDKTALVGKVDPNFGVAVYQEDKKAEEGNKFSLQNKGDTFEMDPNIEKQKRMTLTKYKSLVQNRYAGVSASHLKSDT